ncbi:Crp/Fnr family transcriptional regulator [Lacrimispora sp.]|uniref:Crp/Fnr family transcriptional regulator n=1 Tax=Lacrimispora sp. TaxID=2719234 RepID=UPI00289AA305|nr:Crp/Fnr family transcriptional regulator [Lacrimispora sp.]
MDLSHFIDTAPLPVKNSFIYKEHTKGCYILYPGEENNYLYLLIKGTAHVLIQNISGAGFVLYTYEAYDCFGELELFHNNIKTHEVVAQSDCSTIIIQREQVFEWMKADFEFTKFLIGQLTEKLLKSSQKLTSISLLSVNDRLLYCIYNHHKSGNLAMLTKQAVCSETFIPIRSLNRSIADCKHNNYFEYREKQFHILSEEKLEMYCSSMI